MKTYLYLLLLNIITAYTACRQTGEVNLVKASAPVQLDSLPGSCPYLTRDDGGNMVISWAKELNDSTYVFCYAIAPAGSGSFGKVITVPGSGNLQPHSENLPKILFKPSGEIIALWGASNPNPANKYAGIVYYSQSFDKGANWSKPRRLVDDTAGYDQRYYDVALHPSGEAAIVWLDNRKVSSQAGSALYFAKTEGNTGFRNEKIISEGCCQCCRTDLYIDAGSDIHVLYRGIIRDSIRDMLHTVSLDGGNNFSLPRRISDDNWVLKGCPHTGPSMTASAAGLHFAWFTGGAQKGCFYTRSKDNGGSFEAKSRISLQGAHPQITTLDDGRLLTVWDEPVQVNNKYYRKLGLQLRFPDNDASQQQFLTPDTVTAAYPVILSSGPRKAMVAAVVKKKEKQFVQYQWIDL